MILPFACLMLKKTRIVLTSGRKDILLLKILNKYKTRSNERNVVGLSNLNKTEYTTIQNIKQIFTQSLEFLFTDFFKVLYLMCSTCNS